MEAFLGEIILVAFSYAPNGWQKCQGQILQVNQYQALYSLIGNTYGGDGSSTFKLPNLTPPPNMSYIICVLGSYPSRP